MDKDFLDTLLGLAFGVIVSGLLLNGHTVAEIHDWVDLAIASHRAHGGPIV